MSGNPNVTAEMFPQRVYATNMIGMQMREDDLTHGPALANHVVDTLSKCLLLVFVWRSGIEDDHRPGVVNDVAARVSRGRPSRRAHWKADVIRPERDASLRLTMRLIYRQKSFDEIRSDTSAESSQRMQRRRHRDYLIVHPSIVSATRRQQLAAFQLARDHVRFLL